MAAKAKTAEGQETAPEHKEIEEKKEKFLEGGGRRKQRENSQPPAYLLALLLILGILLGITGAAFLLKPVTVDGGQDSNNAQNIINDVAYRTVPITMLYSDECKSCRQTNTIEELFKVRNIPYTMKKIEAGSEEGKKIIERFGIDRAPTAIIDATKIEFYPTTKKNFESVFLKKNSAYVVPEVNLNLNQYYPVYFLENESSLCSGEKIGVVQFDDYYTRENTRNKAIFYEFTKDFNQNVEMRYSFAQSVSTDENAVMTNIFLTCAGEQGRYFEMERAITGIYCNNPFKGDEEMITTPELLGCATLSNHYGKPLTQVELDIAANRAILDTNKLVECVQQGKIILNSAKKSAEDLGIDRTGTFLLDCRETTSIENLSEAFCSRHPEMLACVKILLS